VGGILRGVRVIEIEGLGPCPFAGMLLADLGAEVIVVHRPGGPRNGLPPKPIIDRGKKSIELDLKDPADTARLLGLLPTADGLMEGFRPGVMERLGLGPDACHAVNPALVYGRMTGWGQDGPLSRTAGHDLNYTALSGALWYASPPGAPPFPPPTLVGDMGGGALYLVVGMLAGILAARQSGRGTVVDAAIVDGSAHLMALVMAMAQGGAFREARGDSVLDGPPWSRCYRCADGGHVSVQCLEPQFRAIFLDILGLRDDPDFAEGLDRAAWPRQAERLETLFATRPRDMWATLFQGTDACVAPVLTPSESGADPHMAARGVWREREGAHHPAPAPRFAGDAPWSPPESPARGEHTRAILGPQSGDAAATPD
jgi:crotonobetainyl-CoA:carnitine CoA-transferase CaiB-like acyl-CoA transferase